MEIVQEILEKQQKELENFKPITVNKDLDCEIDAGTLLVTDPNELDEVLLK